jgi:GNAT superfamily N-acetyltransferase
MNPTIRHATENDVPQIMGLIHELALFEKAPEAVINTTEQMKKDGFGANPLFKCLVAETSAGIIGFALYYYRYSTWKGKCLYLEDFYVKEDFRNFGVGKLLFDTIIETAKHDNCKRINWQVLDWNEPAIKFYEKYNSGFDKEWWNGYIEL